MHRYPGLDLPLRYNGNPVADFYPIGVHRDCESATSDLLPVREVAMMNVMEKLTDKDNWHEKVFDDLVVSKWREEALEIPDRNLWDLATSGKQQLNNVYDSFTVQPHYGTERVAPPKAILTEKVFDHCIGELRSKALYYKKSNIIPTLDACVSIAKSDTLVAPSLHQQLRNAFAVLQDDQMASPDWHPHTNNMTQDLVHPSLYPLVYGRSKVLQTSSVGTRDAINRWSGKGYVLKHSSAYPHYHENVPQRRCYVPNDYWSETYQWLPANVAFQDDGSVKFTSYVNNLHPVKYPAIYQAIEKLIATALPAWDQCLVLNTGSHPIVQVGAGRMDSRFSASMPENVNEDNLRLWDPSNPQEVAHAVVDWEQLRKDHVFFHEPEWDDETESKWRLLRTPIIPEPAAESIEYSPSQMRLADRFRESGLQVIVKMASIELSPEKPDFPAGEWHIDGQMNEHICATALYYVDSENITPSALSFRMHTRSEIDRKARIAVAQDTYKWTERITGTTLGIDNSPSLQNYGSIETREGRLLAFPNVFQHQVSSFELADPTQPGHRRFIALWLVDPNFRTLSTADVPPQQHDWWAEATLGYTPAMRAEAVSKLPPDVLSLIDENSAYTSTSSTTLAPGVPDKLPAELVEMVRQSFVEDARVSMMSKQEADAHRLKLIDEMGRFVSTSEERWEATSYSHYEPFFP
ncbi:hypothetical protein BDV95DRAFT_566610 [Massariosphaeria phaeospora]|uniref:Uncharacterized protein n=1 Tax=Massariosphaeria phaeospora TaxID=100035 RepID=A0A7C8MG97_9PLEO|nr:hypothetical protein BDV95DRAFT_566610 [Massariosphaeria phaeospora]